MHSCRGITRAERCQLLALRSTSAWSRTLSAALLTFTRRLRCTSTDTFCEHSERSSLTFCSDTNGNQVAQDGSKCVNCCSGDHERDSIDQQGDAAGTSASIHCTKHRYSKRQPEYCAARNLEKSVQSPLHHCTHSGMLRNRGQWRPIDRSRPQRGKRPQISDDHEEYQALRWLRSRGKSCATIATILQMANMSFIDTAEDTSRASSVSPAGCRAAISLHLT